jgi:hypothetical protein
MTSPSPKPLAVAPTPGKKTVALSFNFTLNQGTWRYLTTTRKYLVWAIGLGGLAIILLAGVIVPQVQGIFEVQGQLTKQTKLVQQLQQKTNQLREVVTLPSFGQIDQVNSVLPGKKPLLELLAGLNQAVNSSGVAVSSIELAPGSIASEGAKITPSATKGGAKDFDKVDVVISIRGSLGAINDFFAQIEQTAPLTSVTKITLNKLAARNASEEEDEPKFEAQLQITTYFYTKSVTAVLEAPLPTLVATQEETLTKIQDYTFPAFTPQSGVLEGNLEDLFGVELQQAVQE